MFFAYRAITFFGGPFQDPLTKQNSRINKLRADRVKQASLPGESFDENLNQLISTSAKKCFFCPHNVLKSTPKFPDELGVGDRITIGDFALFPNLFVFSENHAVGTLGSKHFTKLADFSTEIWFNALLGSVKYFKAVFQNDDNQKYPSINFNYLPPSASSIIHPHIQIIQDISPTTHTNQLITKSKEYLKTLPNKSSSSGNYWLDLIASEKEIGERIISDNEFMSWVASYSPIGKNEITGIIKIPKTDITKFTDMELKDLAKEIVTALKALYFGRGATSINLSMFLGPIDQDLSDSFRIIIKIVTRPTLMPNYTGDIGFMELLHTEPIAAASPETIAETVKKYFE